MHAVRPPAVHEVMIAAADLEKAEFERDALALACGDTIRRALAAGLTHHELAEAAGLPEAEVRRLAEQPMLQVSPPMGMAPGLHHLLQDLPAADGAPPVLTTLQDGAADDAVPFPGDARRAPDVAR